MILIEFMRKTTNLGIRIPFGEVRGGLWFAGKPMVDFMFALIELSLQVCYLLLFRSYESKCVQLGCFHRGSISLHSNFTCMAILHQLFLTSVN